MCIPRGGRSNTTRKLDVLTLNEGKRKYMDFTAKEINELITTRSTTRNKKRRREE